MTGRTLAHYQILDKLGSGGMGDVYKARDTRLNRLVAIKVLPPDKVANPDRKRRFIQEAQSASALNHPNIVVIHDINEENGVDFMVMEFIEGKTLDAVIPRQGMRLGEALKLAIPVADGLAKAHSAGIIHRDVKPSNIIIADDGRVKILDFGLAKLTEAPVGHNDQTLTARAQTEDGAILGTIAYMSPEQAEGKKLDARSDIFSFGVVLYEMLSGRRAFSGDSKASTVSAILKEDPKTVENLPGEMERILRRCLRKDPGRRFHSMVDVKVELDEVREDSESGTLTKATPVTPARRGWILPVALGAVALAGLGWFLTRPKPAPELRLRQLTADSGLSIAPTISPDGKLVAYSSDRAGGNLDIWVQPLTEGATPIRLTRDPADDVTPSFSPDGGRVVFRSNRPVSGIYLVPSLGGDERLLVQGGHYPRFSPDGQWIAYSSGSSNLHRSQVFIVPVSGGSPKQVGADIPLGLAPVWSADGKTLLITGLDDVGDFGSTAFWATPVAGGKPRKTDIFAHLRSKGLTGLQPLQDLDWRGESLLFTIGSSVWAMDMESESLQVGSLRRITTGTAGLRGVRGTPSRFVFTAGTSTDHLWTLPLDLNSGKVSGPLQALAHAGGSQFDPGLSADGRVLAYLQVNPGGSELRVRDNVSGRESVLFTQRARPRVSPDGAKVAYSTLTPPIEIYLMDAAGGQARKLIDLGKGGLIYGWTPDGTSLVYYRTAPIRWYSFDVSTGKEREMISHPKLDVHSVRPSPDFKWVAFDLPGVPNGPVKIAPLRDGRAGDESEWITVAAYPGRSAFPWWSPDGNLLYFASMKDGNTDLWAQRLDPVTKHPSGEAFPVHHFHDFRTAPSLIGATQTGFRPAVGKDRIIFSLREQLGNVWIGEQ